MNTFKKDNTSETGGPISEMQNLLYILKPINITYCIKKKMRKDLKKFPTDKETYCLQNSKSLSDDDDDIS